MKTRERLNLIDSWRGLAVVNMVLYHLMFDLIHIYGYDFSWWNNSLAYIWQQSIAWSFIFISGWTLNLNARPKKSGRILIGLALLVSLASKVFIPEQTIYFGVLHMLGVVGLLAGYFKEDLEKMNPVIGASLTFMIFLLTKNIYNGYLSFLGRKYFLPSFLYDRSYLFWLGFPSDEFTSGDYFPLIPWGFLYLAGFFIGKLFKDGRLKFPKTKSGLLAYLGRRTLLIYVLHQPIILLLLNYMDL